MDFDKVLQDIFYIPRIMGIFPFDSQFRLSKKLLAYCCSVRFLTAFGTIWTFTYPMLVLAEDSGEYSFDIGLKSLLSLSDIADNFFSIFWWVMKQHQVSFLMKSINELQRREKIILEKQQIRLIHYLLLMVAFSSFLSYFAYSSVKKGLTFTIFLLSYFLISSSTMCMVAQFWEILRLLAHLFRESTQLYEESSVINYGRVQAICEMVNDIFGLRLLYMITILFLQIIFFLYALLLPLYPGVNIQNIMLFAKMMNCIVAIGSIIQACSYFMKQERNFNDDLRRRMIEEKSRVLLRNEKLKFHFLVGQETAFTAYGFFNIDKPLIFSMISAATTYLVIVLQFGSDQHHILAPITQERMNNISQLQ